MLKVYNCTVNDNLKTPEILSNRLHTLLTAELSKAIKFSQESQTGCIFPLPPPPQLKIDVFVLCISSLFLSTWRQFVGTQFQGRKHETLSHAFLHSFFPFIFLTLARIAFIFKNNSGY